VHTLDLLLHFLGRPVSVFAYTDRLAHTGIEVEDVLVAVLRFESGALATLHATTAAFPGTGVRLQVHGSAGTAVLRDDQLEYAALADPVRPSGSVSSASPPGSSSVAVGAPDSDLPGAEPYGAPKSADHFVVGHLRQYEDIVRAVLEGRSPAVDVEDGFLALSVVEAIYESANTGRPVPIDGVS
jgi:UDP-N-acetyl-2-amino-2-deoxyglucuronate dehydrogenase